VRWLVYSLLLANLLFFGATHWLRGRPAATAPALPQLQLVEPRAAAAAGAAATNAAAAGAHARCQSLGPFTDATALAALANALRERNLTPAERSAQMSVDAGFVVRAPLPEAARDRARLLRRLMEAGVREAADATAAAGGQELSLGTYAVRDGAELRATLARSAGADARVEAVTHIVSGYWLDVQLPPGEVAPAAPMLAGGLSLPATTQWSDCPQATPAQAAGQRSGS
jgi:hypothetical protein